jgi:Tfp pilus assembly protein PilN
MKSEINLLPEVARNARMELVKYRRIQATLLTVLGALILILASYGIAWRSSLVLRDSLDDRLVSQYKDRVDVQKGIVALNAQIHAVDKKITTHPRWTVHIPDVLKAVPAGIVITKVELSENPSTLKVTGRALKGDIVVAYQDALQKLQWVDHVDAPLQNFARSPDATVTFTVFRKDDNEGVL